MELVVGGPVLEALKMKRRASLMLDIDRTRCSD